MENYSMTVNAPSDNGNFLKVDLMNVKKAAMILRAVNHKLRQQILKLIDEHGRMTVTEIYVKLRLDGASESVPRDAPLRRSRRRLSSGRWRA